MFKFPFFVPALLLGLFSINAFAQNTAPPAQTGIAKGIARDTAQNYVLKSATVSIYKTADSSLVSYQITNNYGEFNFRNLPLNLPLRLEISHVGYTPARKSFIIPSPANAVDLQTIIVNRKENTLDEVVVSVPPITVNGDTLEFNAAAFKLDSNATVEDMLKVIPNVTLWGDGQITVNGAEVKSLKVNGKSFFGGDNKIALQNISKNALQKVQVYNTVKDQSNPLDSTLEMNLKLKKGKEIGYFGKIGAGYGTNNRFEADASINMYSPKMELALIGAINNVNKTPHSIRTLMSNSTFKGVGTNIDYQSNFRTAGIEQPSTVGASFTYNFEESPTYDLANTLKANYFLQDRNTESLTDVKKTTTISEAEKVVENSNQVKSSSTTNHRFDANYMFTNRGQRLTLAPSFNISRGNNEDLTYRTVQNINDVQTSTNNSFNTGNFHKQDFNLNGEYSYSPGMMTRATRFRGFRAGYALSGNTEERERLNLTEFRSFVNPAANRDFNRKYHTQRNGINQDLDLTLVSLKYLIFGKMRMAGVEFDLTNKLRISSQEDNNRVQDMDTLTNTYRTNGYLSNRIKTDVTEVAPGMKISKMFRKHLSNRFSQNLTLTFHPKQMLNTQDNHSDRDFQNIKRNYHRFAPDGRINYNDHQFGEYYRSYNIDYKTNMRMPTIQQLAPLTDSTNLYYLQRGNLNLRESITRELSISFNHDDQGKKNELSYGINLSFGRIEDNIVDSLLIDDQNRRIVYLVNADGSKYLSFNGNIRKAYKLKSSELQLNLNSNISGGRNPGYTNNVFAFSSNLDTRNELGVHYSYKSSFAIEAKQAYNTYRSKQAAFNTEYRGSNLDTKLSATYNLTKKFTLSSNVSFNNSSSSAAEDITFTIWNASAVYRFLKGNNAEVKFSALDLLRQNNSAINYGYANTFTIGTQNVLSQYFMTTISYYPRQFGKKAPAKK